MSEFNNRIGAQRAILAIVNQRDWREELFGLAHEAINRWVATNDLSKTDPLVLLIRDAGAKLFFLANKSQQQITSDYILLSEEVHALAQKIGELVESKAYPPALPSRAGRMVS